MCSKMRPSRFFIPLMAYKTIAEKSFGNVRILWNWIRPKPRTLFMNHLQGAAKWDLNSKEERKSIITRTYDSCSFIIVFTIANLIYFIRASRRYITY